ncbi:MAG TPA: hypothetical protein VFE37_22495 [Chloroflexota bacterium]|nr:hypothetical protein [Chloroflexota bacterium]
MHIRRSSRILAGGAVALVLASSLSWAAPRPSEAQAIATSCPVQTQSTTTGTSAQQAAVQAARLSVGQKQSLCLAADLLEQANFRLTLDLANALFPGSLGPIGPLSATDIGAHTQSPDNGALFDATVASAATGLSGSILAGAGLGGYLRELTIDNPDPNWQQPVQPVTPPMVFPSPSPETNVPVAASFQSLLTNEVQAVGVAQALVFALRRAQGAAQAGQTQVSQQHLRTSAILAVQLATLLNRESRQRLQMQGAFLTEQLPVYLGDPPLAQALDGAAIALVQFAAAQGVQPPVFAPPPPPSVPVALPQPPPPPPAPTGGEPPAAPTAGGAAPVVGQ